MTSYLTININKENTTKSRRCKLLRYNVKFNLIFGVIPLVGFFVLITSTSTLIAAYIIITIIIIIIITGNFSGINYFHRNQATLPMIIVSLMHCLGTVISNPLTAGAPSISSIMRQFGLLLVVRTECISVDDSSILRNTSALLSSLKKRNNY